MTPDWADETAAEAIEFIALNRLSREDATAYIAERLRLAHMEGRIVGIAKCASTIDRAFDRAKQKEAIQ